MSLYPPELAAHLGREVTTVCRCWRLARADGTVAGFTDHDVALTVDGLACEPQSGFASSEARQTLGLAADTLEIEGALSSASIGEAEIEAGALDGATVETFLVNWREPAQFARIAQAMIGKTTRRDGRFVAELESRMRFLDQPNGRYVLRRCDAELGDARCGVALAGPLLAATGAVTAVGAPFSIEAGGLDGFADGWFEHGVITFSGGALGGRALRVSQHRRQGGVAVLAMVGETSERPAPGDQFSIVAGCDKSFATCKAKFANAPNFRGFPHLPGNDQAYSYAREEGVFDGGPVVP